MLFSDDKPKTNDTLIQSVYHEKYKELEAILITNPKFINYRDDEDRSLLYYAQTPKMLKFLVSKGYDITSTDKDGHNCIAESLMKSKAFMVELVNIILEKTITADDRLKVKSAVDSLLKDGYKKRGETKREIQIFPEYLKLHMYFTLKDHKDPEVRFYIRSMKRSAPKFLAKTNYRYDSISDLFDIYDIENPEVLEFLKECGLEK
jgi:hypothetical protein